MRIDHRGAIVVAALLGGALFWSATDVFPHDAPTGWVYPWACCANYDCQEIAQSSVGETPQGYVIKKTGEVIPYQNKRIKDSPDGEFHWCAHPSGLDKDKTICLFVPPRGF